MDKIKMAPAEPADKGFNDDELANIMSEIENLEKEFLTGPAPTPKSEVAPESAPVAEVESPVTPEAEDFDLNAFEEVAVGTPASSPAEINSVKTSEAVQLKKADLQEEIDKELNQVLEDLVEAPVEVSVPVGGPTPAPAKNVKPFPAAPAPSPLAAHPEPTDSVVQEKTRMSFHVEGNMSVELSFNVGGNEVCFSVNEKDGFIIELGNGAKFTVPVAYDFSHRKAS